MNLAAECLGIDSERFLFTLLPPLIKDKIDRTVYNRRRRKLAFKIELFRQILDVIHSLDVPIIGADIVEYDPIRDINEMTAMVATKLYKEVCGQMLTL